MNTYQEQKMKKGKRNRSSLPDCKRCEGYGIIRGKLGTFGQSYKECPDCYGHGIDLKAVKEQ